MRLLTLFYSILICLPSHSTTCKKVLQLEFLNVKASYTKYIQVCDNNNSTYKLECKIGPISLIKSKVKKRKFNNFMQSLTKLLNNEKPKLNNKSKCKNIKVKMFQDNQVNFLYCLKSDELSYLNIDELMTRVCSN